MGNLRYLLNRLREPSTLAGLGVIAVMFGAEPGKVNVLVEAAGYALGAAAVLLPESK